MTGPLPQVAAGKALLNFDAAELAAAAGLLASAPRLQIINVLHMGGSKRLQEILNALNDAGHQLTQPTVSHHVKDLVDAGMVTAVRVSKTTRYQLNPAGVARVVRALWPVSEGHMPPAECDPWCQGCKAVHVPMAGTQ
jgi:DNA-binding transcriptional ArsR family regulator